MISNQPPSEESKELQRRAAKVFNLAYQRFLDLQQAEERARESIKQASLDRVRGEIASMRSKEDLNRITPLVWAELKALNVPFIRCGVFIIDEENQNIESHLSTPDGTSLGLLNLPFEADNVGNNAVKFWRKGMIYKDHWDQNQFINFMNKMVKLGRLENPSLYQGASHPPDSLDLHFVPFRQGMLYVGNIQPLTDDEIQLVQSLAEAFSIAYARYEDFTQLEQAKDQIESALSELKSTQTQLIHAEKMASLGELTAGIAHEIQNPLNFVNNFSEVSKELIEEMNEEMDMGNLNEVKEITNDLRQNLDKIHHHGQRASGIVKGMLEHSRAGNHKKELTDINQLADEYLRLSYHGLRAKDKSFNAEFKLDLDENLTKVSVIGQEIGRVLLNLINNAFYAVSERAKKHSEHLTEVGGDSKIGQYVPTVIVKTKKIDKFIEIRVGDNGDGIPAHVIDKIFQPFFTTKPTGQGTGLGLSLSYDIITKGHNGSLEVDSVKGLGTEFIIRL
jgi:signal transduction histidine kinase